MGIHLGATRAGGKPETAGILVVDRSGSHLVRMFANRFVWVVMSLTAQSARRCCRLHFQQAGANPSEEQCRRDRSRNLGTYESRNVQWSNS
jgi:hypothetical protein